jgi:UDP-4-amino-4,6-dideoxy-N-acetyl-beta-L-altrosamine transaminase
MKIIPYSRQHINKEDISAVTKALKKNFITQGPNIVSFEKKLKKFTGAKYAVAVNSATSALHISCLALGLKKNDILWTSANTFVASANCALYCGAKIDLVDIDPKTFNIDINVLEKKLAKAKKNNTLPKILVPVAFAGLSCEMNRIKFLSKKYKFNILEDASHAFGGIYKGSKVGSCIYSDITVFSFHAVKILTTGEGGVAMTNNLNLAKKLQLLRSHGITRNESLFKYKSNSGNKWYYEQHYLGYNYRITDFQSALGISQLKRVNKFIQKRNWIADFYKKELYKLPLIFQKIPDKILSSYHLFIIQFKKNIQRDLVYKKMIKFGINLNFHYIPVYHHPFYKKFNLNKKNFPVMNNFFKYSLTLPMYYSLKKKELDFIIKSLKKIIN